MCVHVTHVCVCVSRNHFMCVDMILKHFSHGRGERHLVKGKLLYRQATQAGLGEAERHQGSPM